MLEASHTFANVTARLEDLHGIAIEAQDSANTADMLRVLAGEMQSGLTALGGLLHHISSELDRNEG